MSGADFEILMIWRHTILGGEESWAAYEESPGAAALMLCRAPARALAAAVSRWRVGSARSFAEDAAQLVDLSLYPTDQLYTETGDNFRSRCTCNL